MIFKEGIFRKPRLRTNKILQRYASYFSGHIINVSGANDSDKNTGWIDYYFGDYNSGDRYKNYFKNAQTYTVSNYPLDETPLDSSYKTLNLDLEIKVPEEHVERYDVVFNHTVLEHVFDVFTAFRNLCLMSNDIVILVVPQFQKIHDYSRGYADYWRFTPFAIDRLFVQNGLTVLHRETTSGFSESQYLFYIASKNPSKWSHIFSNVQDVDRYINRRNDGSMYTMFSTFMISFDSLVRKLISRLSFRD